MNAFEQLAASLLTRAGYWVYPSFKVELTKEEKRAIGRHSSPRWEIDLIAYKPKSNELLVVECKAYLDSGGVQLASFQQPKADRYKLFNEPTLREVVFSRLTQQLVESGAVIEGPKVQLALMAAKIKSKEHSDVVALFKRNGWVLFDANWIRDQLQQLSEGSYENDVPSVVAKLLLRGSNG
ncbi:hypothetical protein [Rhodocyclus purpureus]|uniref:hypothetical protein n=1 Tax=Rhodocyclus purpureus TaxID=1067 RepID=UPI001913FAD8|nr:hypothetical protein [Rhodocyclus purpureus]